MHIHPWQITPLQLSIDALNTTTSNLADIAQCTYTHGRLPPSQSSIDALHTTTPNLADLADIAQGTYMHGKSTPQSIEHRCLEYHYTKLGRSSRYSTMHIYAWQIYPPGQLSICAWNTTTPNLASLADIAQCMHGRLTPLVNRAYMPWILLHQTGEIYPRELLHKKDLFPMRVTI